MFSGKKRENSKDMKDEKASFGGFVKKYTDNSSNLLPVVTENKAEVMKVEESIKLRSDVLSLGSPNQRVQSFSISIGTEVYADDSTLAWKYSIPILLPNEKEIFLCYQQMETCIFSYTGNTFPDKISIGVRGLNGFINQSGQQTTRAIVMGLSSVTNKSEMGIETRDLIYRTNFETSWSLGTMRNLEFEIFVDENSEAVELPVANNLNLSFKILHVA